MVRLSKLLLPILAVLALAACEDPNAYPVSGEPCGPGDPVLELDANDCIPPSGAIAG